MSSNWEKEVAASGRDDKLPPMWMILAALVCIAVLLAL